MEYTIYPLVLMRMEVPMYLMTYRMHVGETMWQPVMMFFIKGGDKNILVDTGASAAGVRKYRDFVCEDVMSFEEALAKVNLSPEKIDIVIQTHLMFDHCESTHKCINAKVIVQDEEMKYAFAPHPLQAHSYDREQFANLRLVPVRGDTKIMDGIEVLHTPGHSPGGQSVAIDTAKGKAIITGFCCIGENFRPSEEQRKVLPVIPSAIAPNMYQWIDSALKIKGLADIILPLHEPEIANMETIP